MKKNNFLFALIFISFFGGFNGLAAQTVATEACCNNACLWGWMACNGSNYDNKVHLQLENQECWNYVASTCWTIDGGYFYGSGGQPVTSLCNGITSNLWFEPNNEEYPLTIRVTITFTNGWPPITISKVFRCGDEFDACEFESCADTVVVVAPPAPCCNNACLWGWMACNGSNYDNKVHLQLENQECWNYVASTCWTIDGGYFYGSGGQPVTSLCNGITSNLWFEPNNEEYPLTIRVTITFTNGWPPITISKVFRCGDEFDPCVFESCDTTIIVLPLACCNDACLWGWMACNGSNYDNKVHLQLENQECWNYVSSTCWTIDGGYFYGSGGQPVTSLCNGITSNLWFEPNNEEYPLTIRVTITFNNGWPPITISKVFRCGDEFDPCVFGACKNTVDRNMVGSTDKQEEQDAIQVTAYPNPIIGNRVFVQANNLVNNAGSTGNLQMVIRDLVTGTEIWKFDPKYDIFDADNVIEIQIPRQFSNRTVVLNIKTNTDVQNILLPIIGN